MTTYIVFSTAGATGNWIVPATAVYTLEAIGGGVAGTHGGFFPAKGGGGAAYAKTNGVLLTFGQVIPYAIAPGFLHAGIGQGYGGPTWLGASNILSASCYVFGDGGGAYTGGAASTSKGDVKYDGGDGGHPVINGHGPGGGGAAGPNGAGGDGGAPTGGTGDGGMVAAGASGTSMGGGTVGPGGGGDSGASPQAGGSYGAGGGGGEGVEGADPGTGLLVISYTPPIESLQGRIFGL